MSTDLLFSSHPSITDRDPFSEAKESIEHIIREIPKVIPRIITLPDRNFTIFDFQDKGITSFCLHMILYYGIRFERNAYFRIRKS